MSTISSSEPFVQIKKVTKSFNGYLALDNLSLDIERGEMFCILGGSGSGKTTLLRILAGLESPDKGQIIVDGIDMASVPVHRRPINLMFQSYALFPHMNVWENVAFGLKREGVNKKEIAERVQEMLEMVKLSDLAQRKPHQLSGGQRQRVALIRALIKRPKLLLLDEPLGALDRKLREETQFELIKIQKKVGTTFMVVTHDQEEAMTLSSRICVMNRGQVVQVGEPRTIYEHPSSLHVAKFIGSINIFDGTVAEDADDHVQVSSEDLENPLVSGHEASCLPGQEVFVAVRPEKIVLSTEQPKQIANWAVGKVTGVAYMGDVSLLRVRINHSQKVIGVTLANLKRFEEDWIYGEKVYVSWEADSAMILTH